MYRSYKDGEQVNSIAAINTAYMKDEIARGHILCKGELNQANVNAAYDDFRRELYAEEADPEFFKSERGQSTRQAWLDARDAVATNYPTPTI